MAQTRRIGKHNEEAYLLSAPRFSPCRSGQITPTEPFVHSPFPRLLKLTRMGVCRTTSSLYVRRYTNRLEEGGRYAFDKFAICYLLFVIFELQARTTVQFFPRLKVSGQIRTVQVLSCSLNFEVPWLCLLKMIS